MKKKKETPVINHTTNVKKEEKEPLYVEERISFGSYYTKLNEPNKKDIEKQMLDEFENTFSGTYKEVMAKREEIIKLARKEYNRQNSAFFDEEHNLRMKFKSDLEKEFGVEKNPKKDLLWNIIIERDLCKLIYEYEEYEKLVKLIK